MQINLKLNDEGKAELGRSGCTFESLFEQLVKRKLLSFDDHQSPWISMRSARGLALAKLKKLVDAINKAEIPRGETWGGFVTIDMKIHVEEVMKRTADNDQPKTLKDIGSGYQSSKVAPENPNFVTSSLNVMADSHPDSEEKKQNSASWEHSSPTTAIPVPNLPTQYSTDIVPQTPGRRYPRPVQIYLCAIIESTAHVDLPLPNVDGFPITAPETPFSIDVPLCFTSSQFLETRSHSHRMSHVQYIGRDETEVKNKTCLLSDAMRQRKHITIVGNPGSGKTTLLRKAAYQNASSALAGEPRCIPVLLECSSLDRNAPIPKSITEAIGIGVGRFVREDHLSQVIQEIHDSIETEGGVLLVDAIDEVHPNYRSKSCEHLIDWARMYPLLSIITTSRAVGVHGMQQALSGTFEGCTIEQLSSDSKRSFLHSLSELYGLPSIPDSLNAILDNRTGISSLTDTILMLAIAAQVLIDDPERIGRDRIELLDQAVNQLVARKKSLQQSPVSFNEVVPHLEWLALKMRRESKIRCFRTEAETIFTDLRSRESDSELSRRSEIELVDAAIDPVGILAIAGQACDDRGRLVDSVQFCHQIFQEYLASRAYRFRRGGVLPLDDFFSQFEHMKIVNRTVSRTYKEWSDAVIANDWQETIRMTIARLPSDSIDQVFDVLLPRPSDDKDATRAKAVFAMTCLADGPNVSGSTLKKIVISFCDVLEKFDNWQGVDESSAMIAARAASSSSLGSRIIDKLLEVFQEIGDERSLMVGFLIAAIVEADAISLLNAETQIARLKETASSSSDSTRLLGFLSCLASCFKGGDIVLRLPSEQIKDMVSLLANQLSVPGPLRLASLWALKMATAEGQGPLRILPQATPFSVSQQTRLESIACDDDVSNREAGLAACLATTTNSILDPPVSDVILELAHIADGEYPRHALPAIRRSENTTLSEALLRRLIRQPLDALDIHYFWTVLGRLGIYSDRAISHIREFLRKNWSGDRTSLEEAAVYLGCIGSDIAVEVLVEASRWVESDCDGCLLFGVILADNVTANARLLSRGDFFPVEIAFCLAGSKDANRGLAALHEIRNGPPGKSKDAARMAIAKHHEWKELTDRKSRASETDRAF